MYNMNDINAACESLSEALMQCAKALVSSIETVLKDWRASLKRLGRYMRKEWKLIRITHSIEYKTAATQYPKLAHLARHAKKKRVRKKNVKRLYQIGDDILCGRRKL